MNQAATDRAPLPRFCIRRNGSDEQHDGEKTGMKTTN